MKTAILILDGINQLVLTPETDFEKEALNKFKNNPLDATINSGYFYECRGGYLRQSIDEQSLILRINKV